jgi:hypothetical protein
VTLTEAVRAALTLVDPIALLFVFGGFAVGYGETLEQA